jgi:hypothetical protein
MAFERKGKICGALHDECKVVPSSLAERPSICDSCILAVRDIYSVLRRTSGRKDYASKKHVWQVLDSICTEMEMRHPQVIAQRVQVKLRLFYWFRPNTSEVTCVLLYVIANQHASIR